MTNTAIMVFSLSAELEARRKQLFGSTQRKKTTDFFQTLINSTDQLAENCGTDVIWMDEKKQRGTDFSSRFTHAFEDLFNQGYQRVIAIGNDCPGLEHHHIQAAIQEIQQNDLVLGPAKDGGVYLLGVSKEIFDCRRFQDFGWKNDSLYTELSGFGQKNNLKLSCFEVLTDLDNHHDLVTYSENAPKTYLGYFISKSLKGLNRLIYFYPVAHEAGPYAYYTPLRAPPQAHS